MEAVFNCASGKWETVQRDAMYLHQLAVYDTIRGLSPEQLRRDLDAIREEITTGTFLELSSYLPWCKSFDGGRGVRGHFSPLRFTMKTVENTCEKAGTSGSAPRVEPSEPSVHNWLPFLVIALSVAGLFVVRLTAPSNLLDQDQERPAAYVLDAVKNNHWFCQRDLFGDIMSKPPLWAWISALATLACGRISEFSLYLPGALAALGTACLVFHVGRKQFGVRTASYAVIALLLTPAAMKGIGLARTDGVFAFTVTAAALLAFRAWSQGKGWTWFWLAAAAATLTKGPLGVVLAASGLIASGWERKSGEKLPLRGNYWPGLGLFLLLVGGWFWLAYQECGPPLVAKMVGKELMGHALGKDAAFPAIWQQPLYYLGRAAPWSLLAYYGLWRIWRHPSPLPAERRFERFLFCWFLAGLLIFSTSSHRRADLLWPLMPAAALIAGRELQRLTSRLRPLLAKRLPAVTVVLITAGYVYYYYFSPNSRTEVIRETAALKQIAVEAQTGYEGEFPLTHADSPMALQVYLNTLRPLVSYEVAARLLRGSDAAFVAVNKLSKLKAAQKPGDPPIYTLLAAAGRPGANQTRIVSNRPALALSPSEPFAFYFDSLLVRASNASLLRATEGEFSFVGSSESSEIVITNESSIARNVKVSLVRDRQKRVQEHTLAPGEVWRVSQTP